MTAIVEIINAAGGAFVDFALPMLVQSCVLILVLLAVDLILRKRVRAVFRYCIWMLVLIKLVLPPTFQSPVSIGTWFGDSLKAPATALIELAESQPAEPAGESRTMAEDILSPSARVVTPAPVSPVDDPRGESPSLPIAGVPRGNSLADADSESLPGAVAAVRPAEPSLSWQGLVFLSWVAIATSLLLLLVQRAFFVRGLVADADEASAALQDELTRCRAQVGLRKEVTLRLSALAGSPAACGLVHPVILIPQNLAPRLAAHDLQAVLLHELAHIKRGDLWVSLAQTLLQIVYFYNPLLWLANSLIRRTREQAVDEAVLVAMGEAAQQYPETLVNVAKLAFRKRPALSLRLLGVVESKSALSARIRHILNRPLPKTARLGIAGLTIILATAVVLLPMARAQRKEAGGTASATLADGVTVEPVGAKIVSSDAGAESAGPIDLGAADETGRNHVKVTLGWSGQEVNVPGPLVLPENVKGTKEFQRWQKSLVRDKITFVDAGGRKCVAECKGMGKSPDGSARAEYIVTRYRPDQTPLAYSYFPRGDGLAAEWQTYFPNGAKRIWGLNQSCSARGLLPGGRSGK
jgi:beta-lactamase regulating signal transducer with metallopeptidase domain